MTYEQLSIDVDDTHDAALVRAVLAAKKPNGDYTNIHATAGGNIKVSIEEQNGTANLATETKQDSIIAAIQAIPGGGDPTNYTTRMDEGATYTYVGKAVPGTATSAALWRIQRYPTADFSAGLYADGNANLDNIWDNRASLTYT